MRIGDLVKINIKELDQIGWEGLTEADNKASIDFKTYIENNKDQVYRIKELLYVKRHLKGTIVLDDEILQHTSFNEEELISVS